MLRHAFRLRKNCRAINKLEKRCWDIHAVADCLPAASVKHAMTLVWRRKLPNGHGRWALFLNTHALSEGF
eukprot:1159854-Pelagomonas_calceolata.AAC.5